MRLVLMFKVETRDQSTTLGSEFFLFQLLPKFSFFVFSAPIFFKKNSNVFMWMDTNR
jgi:hypothetical protein